MNRFELFCMVYYVLDAAWEDSKSPQLGTYLSGANPFLFSDIGSADPEVFADFCQKIPDKSFAIDDSYRLASAYIASLNHKTVSEAFHTIDESEWGECVRDYLSQAHKGSEIQ